MSLFYLNMSQALTIPNSHAASQGSREDDDDICSVMAEHRNQDVDLQLAQLVVDSTTSVDETKETYDNARVERKPSSDNADSEDLTFEEKVKESTTPPDTSSGITKTTESDEGDGSTQDSDIAVSSSPKNDTDAASLRKDDEKPVTRASSSLKKLASIKPTQLNRAFLAGGATGQNGATHKMSLVMDKGSKAPSAQSAAAVAPKPRLIGKIASGLTRTGPLGLSIRKNGDSQPVWNKNQPVAPAPAKEYTDEELSKKYGIHMASRLQSEDASKESKWADIDDDDEDWVPEAIEWTDGSKMSLPQPEEDIEVPLEKPTPDEPTDVKEIEEVIEPVIEPKPLKFVEKRFSPLPSNRDSTQLKQLPPQAPPVQETPRPGPWAPIPSGVPFPTPRPLITQAFPAAGSPLNRQVDSQRPSAQPLPSTKEVATDDFNRTWREPGPAQSRELFIPETGKLEPVQESNRNRDNRQRTRPEQPLSRPSVLQRPNSNSTQIPGPAEPSSAFQQQRTPYRPDEARRRRASSGADSATLNSAGRRLSINRTMTNGSDADLAVSVQIPTPDLSRTATEKTETNRAPPHPVQQGPPPWSRSSTSHPEENASPSSPVKPEVPVEDPIVMQQRIMKESREAAAKRRRDEEKAEEEARTERLRKKLEQLGHYKAVEEEKEKALQAQAQESTHQSTPDVNPANPVNPVNPVESVVVRVDELPQAVDSDQLKISDKTTEQKVTHGTSRDQMTLPTSAVPEKQVNEPWRSTSAGSKGWSGPSRQAQNNNPWHPVEGEQRRFPQLESLPFNGLSEKSSHRDSSDEQSQSSVDQQNRISAIKTSNSSTRSDHNLHVSHNNDNSAQNEYLNRPTHSSSHLPPLSPQQHHHHMATLTSLPLSPQQQQHQLSHSEAKSSSTNTFIQTNYNQSYRDSSRNSEREQPTQYTQRQEMRGQNQTRNRTDVLPDLRGRPIQNNSWLSSNSDSSNQVSLAWQTAAYDIQRGEAMEKERRRVERLAQEEEAASKEGGEKQLTPSTATIETTWRRVEIGKDGRRRYVGVVKSSTEQAKPENPANVNDKEGSDNVNHISESMPISSERHHSAVFSQGPPVMAPQFSPPAPGSMRHIPSSGLPMPRSRFFPGSMVPMPGQHPGMNEHVYPNSIEPMVVSPPTMQAYPHHTQPMVNQNHSSVVVTLPSQQHTAYSQHGMNRFNSPPHVSATLAHKVDLSAPQLASTSSKSAFEMVQSKILGMVRPVGSHSRDASTELQADVHGNASLVGDLTSLELETTSKPSFDEFREAKVTVSLPRTNKSDSQETRGWESLTRFEPFTLPSIDDLTAELFPQDFGSLPTVRLPRTYPDALRDPAKPPPEVGRGSKNGKKRLEVFSVDRDAGPLFNTTNEHREKLFFLKLDANSPRSEGYLLKGRNNPHRRMSGAMKPSVSRGNYKMVPKQMSNSHYVQPPTYPPMGPMLHNMNHSFPPRGSHPQNSTPNRLLHTPRKISGAV